MNKRDFQNLAATFPIRIESVVSSGPHGFELAYAGEGGRRTVLGIHKEWNGRVAIRSGSGEFQVPVPPSVAGRPKWGDVVEALRGLIEFPATDRLFWAIGEARAEAAAGAIEGGADIHATNGSGFLPLDALAISFGCRADVVRLIFGHQGRAQDRSEFLIANTLRDVDDLALIRLMLLNAGAIDQSRFRDAVRSGDFEMAGAELAAGASVDAITLNRVPLLVERILHRDAAGVAWLLAAGANPNWEQPAGDAPIPVFIAEALPHLRERAGSGFVLTPRSAAQLVEFSEGAEMLSRMNFRFFAV